MEKVKEKLEKRFRRHKRVRSKVIGTAKRPRLSVFRSNKNLYAQLIDDEKGITLAATSSKEGKEKNPKERAREIGKRIAEKALEKKITQAVFDRGGFLYTGSIKTLADGAREGGLKF